MVAHYPEEWEAALPRDSEAECTPIVGEFEQQGLAAVYKGPFWNTSTEQKASYLSSLIGIYIVPYDAITHLSINLSEQDPSVTLWVSEEKFLTHGFQLEDLSCDSGFWRIELDLQASGSSGIFLDLGVIFSSLLLSEADDGSIIISRNEKMIGTALLLPLYFQGKDWHRFTPFKSGDYSTEAHAPYGVLSDEKAFARLLPPPTQKSRKQNSASKSRCLDTALEQFEQLGGDLTSDEQARIAGRSTQAFLVQWNKKSKAYPRSEYINRTIGHTPSTQSSQFRKPHWLDPSVADRYVLCLLDDGYVWEDVNRTERLLERL